MRELRHLGQFPPFALNKGPFPLFRGATGSQAGTRDAGAGVMDSGMAPGRQGQCLFPALQVLGSIACGLQKVMHTRCSMFAMMIAVERLSSA